MSECRAGKRGRRAAVWLAVVWALGAKAACSRAEPSITPASGGGGQALTVRDGEDDRVIRVGNQARGVQDQPDYDRAALEIRERVEGRLPNTLPSPKVACEAMLAAVDSMYTATEGSASRPAKIVASTRAEDLKACIAQTSPAAAACVRILVSDREGEYPWLLDQCSRAFP